MRDGGPGAGSPFFDAGLEDFEEAEGVGEGMGPRFNLDGFANRFLLCLPYAPR